MKKSFNKLCSKLYANFTSIKKCTKYSKIDCSALPQLSILESYNIYDLMKMAWQVVLSAIRYSPNIQIFHIQYSHIQYSYWVADTERCKTFLKYSFIDLEQPDNNSNEWPDLYKQWVSTYSDLGFKVYFMLEISICKSNKYVQPCNCFMA